MSVLDSHTVSASTADIPHPSPLHEVIHTGPVLTVDIVWTTQLLALLIWKCEMQTLLCVKRMVGTWRHPSVCVCVCVCVCMCVFSCTSTVSVVVWCAAGGDGSSHCSMSLPWSQCHSCGLNVTPVISLSLLWTQCHSCGLNVTPVISLSLLWTQTLSCVLKGHHS